MTPGDPERLAERLAVELLQLPPMEIAYRPDTVFALVALIQLALRHPGVTGSPRDAGTRFLAAAREYFADAPAVLEAIRRGDDPAEDLPWRS